MKRLLASFLAVLILMGAAPLAAAADAKTDAYIKRGEAADTLLLSGKHYNAGLLRSDIIKGNENGDLEEDKPVTRAEALVMLSRAFGKLPSPIGDNARSGYNAAKFTDVPDWAKTELENVFAAGIIDGTSATEFSPEEYITAKQLDLFIRRIYALKGTNLKDDFYAAVNKQALDSSVIRPGYISAGGFSDLGIKANTQVAGIIKEISLGDTKTSGEKNIANLYNNVLDKKARNEAGITPIKKYLDLIDKAGSLNDVMAANLVVEKDLGANLLLGFGLAVDAKDGSKYTLSFGTISPSLGQSGYAGATAAQKGAYLSYIKNLFTLGGVSSAEAEAEAQLIWNAEAAIAEKSMPYQDLGDVDKTYNVYSMNELKAIFPNVDLDTLFSVTGMKQTDHIIVSDPGQLKAVASFFDDDHSNYLKAFMRLGLLGAYGSCLNDDFKKASDEFGAAYLGSAGTVTDEEYAASIVQSLVPQYLSEAYVLRYFSPQAKSDVKEMISEIIGEYKARINALSWMSDATKAKAVKKLDNMIIKVGYPDKWGTDLYGVTLKSASEGGSFFDNIITIAKAGRAKYPSIQNLKVDKNTWLFTSYTINACYDAHSNSIEFPAGILQAPFYDVNASREENLGGIGYIIAHEITHAFDNNGAKFDENGNATDWWTKEDYAAFQKLCSDVVNFYDGKEAAPGITCNGALTLSENIADQGAIACITQVAGKMAHPDYKKLYTSMAKIWCSSYTREAREMLSRLDLHSPDKLRGGLALSTQDEFYKAFNIQPGDGMYIAPEDRIKIW